MNVLHPAEVRQLVAAVDLTDPFGPRDRALLELCIHTGLRVSELVSLDISTCSTPDGQPRQSMWLTETKGRTPRVVPLNQTAQQAIVTILDLNRRRGLPTSPDSPLLVTRKHGRMTVRAVQRLLQALREKADLDVPATPHSLRHVFGTKVLSCTSNLRVTQALLGHKSISSTMIYTHPTREEMHQAVERLVAVE